VQISLDGATAEVNDAVRGPGSYATAVRAMKNLKAAGMRGFKLSVVVTRHNVSQLDELKALADRYGAQLRLTRFRPSGRGAETWHQLHPRAEQQRQLYDWLTAPAARAGRPPGVAARSGLRRQSAGWRGIHVAQDGRGPGTDRLIDATP
jgi:MoaA/NifB/PqqE/SkfB family radical SAM enzyme